MGQGGVGVPLLIPPDTHGKATQGVREQAQPLPLTFLPGFLTFSIAKVRNIKDIRD